MSKSAFGVPDWDELKLACFSTEAIVRVVKNIIVREI